jgi:hypothetical protein
MINFLKIITRIFIGSCFVAAILFIPIFIVIWIFGDFKIAVRYSLIVSLIVSLIMSYLDTTSNVDATKNSLPDYRKNIKSKRFSGVFVLVSIFCLIAYRVLNPIPIEQYTITPVVKSDTQEPIAASAHTPSYESSCSEIRAKYHRAAQKALRGEYVSPSEDVVLPPRCRY